MMGLLAENGPCEVNPDGQSTKVRNLSWNDQANALWIDQPVGSGFSNANPVNWPNNSITAADDSHAFLQVFFTEFRQYNKDVFIAGESYAGHYIPALSHAIVEGNKDSSNVVVNLKGISMGNGMVWPGLQFQYYAPAANGSLPGTHAVVNESTLAAILEAQPICAVLDEQCSNGNMTACSTSFSYCGDHIWDPIIASGHNPFDLRALCPKKTGLLCYNFSMVDLNLESTQKAPGTHPLGWSGCNLVMQDKTWWADFPQNMAKYLPAVLEAGVKVLTYNGDVDYIANYLGGKAWALAMDWTGKDAFNEAEDKNWVLPDGKVQGILRQSGPLTFLQFLQFHEAGHMVPINQPAATLYMINTFMEGTFGQVSLSQTGNAIQLPALSATDQDLVTKVQALQADIASLVPLTQSEVSYDQWRQIEYAQNTERNAADSAELDLKTASIKELTAHHGRRRRGLATEIKELEVMQQKVPVTKQLLSLLNATENVQDVLIDALIHSLALVELEEKETQVSMLAAIYETDKSQHIKYMLDGESSEVVIIKNITDITVQIHGKGSPYDLRAQVAQNRIAMKHLNIEQLKVNLPSYVVGNLTAYMTN
ncbi:unnamed protein product [Polarella glacialis]|uniref:Carboxypeptidase n=1 Tax=Polarella glacialis TaxID=89957 RepID=A0A813ENX4_POLGL|nr:unnamed protein product [Polarella glacialis]